MSEMNNKKKQMNLYELIELDVHQKFYPKKKRDASSFFTGKEE